MGQQFAYFAVPFIPLLPLIGALFAFLAGRQNKDSAGLVATCAAVLSFGLTVFMVVNLPDRESVYNLIFQWFQVGGLSVDFALRVDHLNAVLCLVITGVGSLIHIYSTAYMHDDESRHRFFAYLNLFLSAMLVLVMGANLAVMFVGWEGVGLCSYLLIGFWYKNGEYAKAGQKAFVMNRIGDVGFLIAMFLLIKEFHTLDFASLKDNIPFYTNGGMITAIALCLFVGAIGKSAQIPLFTWLPDAMAGPTPVSALIHAATMVTAGVYLLARMNFLFSLSEFALAVILIVALVTAFVAATTALFQNDIKKVLAYSTVSQLGFMFMAAGCGAYWVSIFHLVTHAFFKACLFLAAGAVIQSCHHEQDMRKMGGLFKTIPVIGWSYLFATFAIAGIFPFAGYQSKHAILEALHHNHNPLLASVAQYIPTVALVTAFLTALYMSRSFVMTFMGSYRGDHTPHHVGSAMKDTVLLLALFSLAGGVVLQVGLPGYLAPVLPDARKVLGSSAAQLMQILSKEPEELLASWPGVVGIVLGAMLFWGGKVRLPNVPLPKIVRCAGRVLITIGERKYFFDEIYDLLIVKPLYALARTIAKFFEPFVIDGVVRSTAATIEITSELSRMTQTGQVRHYAFGMMCSGLVMIALYLVAF